MIGGSVLKMDGGKRKVVKKAKKSGGSDCSKMSGGKKNVKKSKNKKGGGFCIGNLHPFESTDSSTDDVKSASVPTPTPIVTPPTPTPLERPSETMTGGAKKRKVGPYAKFVKKHFASVQKKNPNFKATDCMKQIAKMWKAQKK